MTEPTLYKGGCHCGKVRFEVEADLSEPAIACNCSICGKTGSLLSFVPTTRFTLQSGGEDLTDYQFGKKQIHHLFCKVCGVRSFARGTGPDGVEMIAINARCLEDVDPARLPVHHFDGKSL
jgi:hypothetical protein